MEPWKKRRPPVEGGRVERGGMSKRRKKEEVQSDNTGIEIREKGGGRNMSIGSIKYGGGECKLGPKKFAPWQGCGDLNGTCGGETGGTIGKSPTPSKSGKGLVCPRGDATGGGSSLLRPIICKNRGTGPNTAS